MVFIIYKNRLLNRSNKPIRCNSLKGNYTEDILKERIKGKTNEKQKEFLDDK